MKKKMYERFIENRNQINKLTALVEALIKYLRLNEEGLIEKNPFETEGMERFIKMDGTYYSISDIYHSKDDLDELLDLAWNTRGKP